MAGNSQNTTPPPVNEEITSNHLLFLHQTNHPGLILISKKLTGSYNFISWKRSILIALNVKNKMKLVTGTFPEPSIESELRGIYERNNDILISSILNTVNRRNTTVPNTSYDRRSAFRKGVYYGNCWKEGHYQEECNKIVGYPMGHPLHGKYQPAKVTRPTQNNRPPRTINMTIGQYNSRPQSPTIPQNSSLNNDGHGSIGQGIFSSHNIKIPKFIATLITDLKDAWIIDSGATDHVSITLTLMHDIYTLSTPILVSLPNGQTVEVTTYGSVTLNTNIILHNVFHIPSFTYNIIFVSKLLQGTSISLTLTTSYCIFQDQNKRIAHGTLCDGLYFILPTVSSYTTEVMVD
ncbi:cysteine-rich receptor-like protein kinase 8 [Tanacetum coccineum]